MIWPGFQIRIRPVEGKKTGSGFKYSFIVSDLQHNTSQTGNIILIKNNEREWQSINIE